MTLVASILCPGVSTYAQGTIFGSVTNSGGSTPANGQISFFGFLSDTDEEIRLESSTGAGYDAGNWFDNFANYLTEGAGNPYDYYLANTVNGEGFHLQKLQPNNGFQQENITLAAVSWPATPTGLVGQAISSSEVLLRWNGAGGLTYHVYRREAASNGSLFRLDNVAGLLSDRGVTDSFFVDATANGASSYDYVIIAEDGSGNYSAHSAVITVNSANTVAPTVLSISPTNGAADGGTAVNIFGTDFDPNGATASIGGSPLTSITVVSPFLLTGITPAGSPGPADVAVTNTASALTSTVLAGAYSFIGNAPPVLDSIGARSVDEGQLLTIAITASDPDGPVPSLTAAPLPNGATLSDNGGGSWTFDWTPAFSQSGDYLVTFNVSDGSLSDSEVVQITVNNVNRPPVLSAIGPQSVDEGQLLSFDMTATDPDGTTPALTTSPLPPGATVTDNGGGSWTFDWTPSFGQASVYSVTFTVTDGSLAADSETVEISVNHVNRPPVIGTIGSRSVDEGQTLSFDVTASDVDGVVASLIAVPLPNGAALADNGGGSWTFTWPTSFGDVGVYSVTFTATDDSAAVDSEVVQITVNNVNQPPVLGPIGPQAVDEGQLLSFDMTATDPDGTTPTLTSSALPPGATVTDNGGGNWTFDWTPTFGQASVYSVTFTVTDDSLAADSEAVEISVNHVNRPPVLGTIGSQSVDEGQTLSFDVSASDVDGVVVSLIAVPLPNGAALTGNGSGSWTFNWPTSFGDVGVYSVTFTATDDSAAVDSEVVQITVNNVNQPPVLGPIGAQAVDEGQLLSFTTTSSDPDLTIPTLSANGLPAGASYLDNTDATGTFAWTPDFTQSGSFSVTFLAFDGSLTDSEIVQITVNQVDRPPVLDPIGAQSIQETFLMNIAVSASHPDGVTIVLSTSPLPNGASFVDNLDGTGAFAWTPDFSQAGVYPVTFFASDALFTDSEVVQITVTDLNRPPVLIPIGAQAVDEGQLLSFTTTSSDPDLTIPTLSANGLPAGAAYLDNTDGTGTFSWTPDFSQSGNFSVTFLAFDGSLSDSEIVLITVNQVDQIPVLDSIGPKMANIGQLLAFIVTAIDIDLTTPALFAEALPTGATFADNADGSGSFNWTPASGQEGAYAITFIASDGGLSDTEVVQITVSLAVNRPPVLDPIGARSVATDSTLNFSISASDPDGTVPALFITDSPPGATLVDNGDGTAVFDWTPGLSQIGTYNPAFLAQDSALAFDFEVVTITVFKQSCCQGSTGNIDCDPSQAVDIADLTFIIDHLFINFTPLCCKEEANVDADPQGTVDIADLTVMIDHLFINFGLLPDCQ